MRTIEPGEGSLNLRTASSMLSSTESVSSTSSGGGLPPASRLTSMAPRVGWNRIPNSAAAAISASSIAIAPPDAFG